MSHSENPTPDPLDDLLTSAFAQALTSPDNPSVLEEVMNRIARQQRRRTLIVGLIGVVAAVLAALGALPLIGLVESLFAGLADTMAAPMPEHVPGLPVLAVLIVVGMTAGWLFLEEAF